MAKDTDRDHRPSPEEILARIQREDRAEERGRFKIFLGFAAGVGKTYSMLSEANRRKKERGQDVVIGYVETHGRKGTIEAIGDLEIVPRKTINYRGTLFEEMDTEAIIERNPQWVLIDEIAHTNVPGSFHEKRYQDILQILDAGISVEGTLNVQHLESLNDAVQQITGVRVRETVPDWLLGRASEVVTIDITPRALINRLQRGDVYPQDKVPQALQNFFTEGNLSSLREIALREVASEVDRSVQTYRQERRTDQPWQTREKVMVCISPDQPSLRLLRRGWRIANRLKAEIVAVYVPHEKTTIEQQKILETDFALAARLGIQVERADGPNIPQALVNYALKNGVTEIVLGQSATRGWKERFGFTIVNRLICGVHGIDVLVVANTKPSEDQL